MGEGGVVGDLRFTSGTDGDVASFPRCILTASRRIGWLVDIEGFEYEIVSSNAQDNVEDVGCGSRVGVAW